MRAIPRWSKNLVLLLISAGFLVTAFVALGMWREARRPRRVWVLAAEKHVSEAESFGGLGYNYGDQMGETENSTLRTEEKITNGFRARGATCMVLTHDKAIADYYAVISVTRTPGSVDHFGDAQLSVVKRNGDVVVSRTFSQYRSFGDPDDIGEQPIKALTDLLCKKENNK